MVLLDVDLGINTLDSDYDPWASVVGRLHALLGYIIPSAIMLASDVRDTEWMCAVYTVGNSLMNVLLLNCTYLFLSTKTKLIFSVAWTVPISVIFSISAVSNSLCDLFDLFVREPTGVAPRLTSGLSFPLYLNAAAIIGYLLLHLRGSSLGEYTQIPIRIISKLLYGSFLLSLFIASVVVNALLRGGSTGGSGGRGNTFLQIQGIFIIGICVIALVVLIPIRVRSLLLLRRASHELGVMAEHNKLRASVVAMFREMVPRRVYQALSSGTKVEPKHYEFVTVFFCDVVGFTTFCAGRDPFEVVDLISRLFGSIDGVCRSFGGAISKIETVGDSYLAVGGLDVPASTEEERSALTHTMAKFALAVREAVASVRLDENGCVQLRIGLHCGAIVTGLTGQLTPRFCVFGDTINTASRMETTGAAGMVHCSQDFAELLSKSPPTSLVELSVCPRDEPVDVKGKGVMNTSWIYRAEGQGSAVQEQAQAEEEWCIPLITSQSTDADRYSFVSLSASDGKEGHSNDNDDDFSVGRYPTFVEMASLL